MKFFRQGVVYPQKLATMAFFGYPHAPRATAQGIHFRSTAIVQSVSGDARDVLLLLSPRLLAEPRRPEERSVKVRTRIQDHAVCPQQFHQFIDPFKQAFDSIESQRSFVRSITMSLTFRVPAAFVPRGYKPARRAVRRPSPARKLYSNTRKESRNRLRIPHDTIARLYTVQLWTVSARASSPAQMPNSIH